jgi:hypothetical protein
VLFPNYLVGCAKKCLGLAKRMRNPKLAQTFTDGARRRVISSNAKVLGELKRELQELSDGMCLCVPITNYSPNQRNVFWRASTYIGEQFGCSAELRPDGCLWFVKRG